MIIQTAEARSIWRVRVVFDGPDAGLVDATKYSIVREDGAFSLCDVTFAFLIDSRTAEIAIKPAIVEGLIYRVTHTDAVGYALCQFRSPSQSVLASKTADDPEAEAFGVDIDWLTDELTADGDMQEIRGRKCVLNDLVCIARTIPGELVHSPEAGAGLPREINGPMTEDELLRISSAVKSAWSADDRVESLLVSVSETSNGEVSIDGKIKTIALNDSLDVSARIGE